MLTKGTIKSFGWAGKRECEIRYNRCDFILCLHVIWSQKRLGYLSKRPIDKVFKNHIGRNKEVYVVDILVKVKASDELINDLKDTLYTLHNYRLKLNPRKCTFGLNINKFLGYMIILCYIEPNPEKVDVLATMGSPWNIHEVQKFTCRIVALSRFIS